MTIRAKILLACLSLAAVTLVFGTIVQRAQSRMGEFAVHIYDDSFMSMSYLRSAQNKLLAFAHETADRPADPSKVTEVLDDAVGDLAVARERALSQRGKDAASRLQEQVSQISQEFAATRNVPSRARLAELGDRLDVAVEINAGDGFRARAAIDELIGQASRQTWAAMGVSLAVAFAITLVLSRSILPVIAEGVETESQLAFLVDEGCHQVQGHLLSEPKPIGSFRDVFLSGSPRSEFRPERLARIRHRLAMPNSSSSRAEQRSERRA